MIDTIRSLLPPYGESNDSGEEQTTEQDRCDHETWEPSEEPTSIVGDGVVLIDDYLVVIESKKVDYYCQDCGTRDLSAREYIEDRAVFFEPAGAVEAEGDYITAEEAREYAGRMQLANATNEAHPEPEERIVNESENPDFDRDDGAVRTETVEVGE